MKTKDLQRYWMKEHRNGNGALALVHVAERILADVWDDLSQRYPSPKPVPASGVMTGLTRGERKWLDFARNINEVVPGSADQSAFRRYVQEAEPVTFAAWRASVEGVSVRVRAGEQERRICVPCLPVCQDNADAVIRIVFGALKMRAEFRREGLPDPRALGTQELRLSEVGSRVFDL